MRMTSFTAAVASHRTRRSLLALGPVLLLLTGACGLLDTESPNTVEPGELDSPAGAEARRVGAIADFTFAKDGDGDLNLGRTDGQVLLSGLMTDEFVLSTTPPTEQEVDQRRGCSRTTRRCSTCTGISTGHARRRRTRLWRSDSSAPTRTAPTRSGRC